MKTDYDKVFSSLIYTLFYPGILGSMIYDIAKNTIQGKGILFNYGLFSVGLLAILLLFIIDYAYI